MILKESINRISSAIFSAEIFLESKSQEDSWLKLKKGIIDFLIVLIPCSMFLFVTAIIKESVSRDIKFIIPNEIQKTELPWGILFFPLLWLLYTIVFGSFRHLVVIIMGEKNRSYTNVIWLGLYSTIPLALAGSMVTIINDLLPLPISDQNYQRFALQVRIEFLLLFFAWTFEGWICIKLYKKAFEQNLGRAFLTWFLPSLILVCTMILLFRSID